MTEWLFFPAKDEIEHAITNAARTNLHAGKSSLKGEIAHGTEFQGEKIRRILRRQELIKFADFG